MNTAPPTSRQLDMFGVIEHVQAGAPWDARRVAGRAAAAGKRPQDRLLLGNWQDPALLAGEGLDTVLADYLVGAVENCAPCFREALFARLRPLVRGRLYVVGVDPYVVGAADMPAGLLVQAIGRLRDACALLAGVIPRREYPAEWIMQRLGQVGLRIVFAHASPITTTWAGWNGSSTTAAALAGRIATLREQAMRLTVEAGGLAHGHDYVIAAVPA